MKFTTILACALALASLAAPAQPASTPPGAASPGPAGPGIDPKLGVKVPDLILNDENGNPVHLATLIDKPTILTLNYFSCAGICTPLLNGMVDLVNQTKGQPGQD